MPAVDGFIVIIHYQNQAGGDDLSGKVKLRSILPIRIMLVFSASGHNLSIANDELKYCDSLQSEGVPAMNVELIYKEHREEAFAHQFTDTKYRTFGGHAVWNHRWIPGRTHS